MIGLNTSIFKSAGRKLVNLLGALKDRAAYYENGTDSVAEKNRIDDLGVLDKATILLTPTATSDARVHSVKTYTGDELVTNGNFSTSDLSGFGSIYANISIENERLKVSPSAGQGYGLATVAWNSQVGDVFLVKATAYKGNATSTVIKTHTGITIDNITKTDDEWTYLAYGVATSTQSIIRLQVNGADGVYGYFDNVSVTNVSSDFDFDRASSATRINSSGLVQDMQSITDPELVLNGDFEELGDELVTNGTFDTDSDWNLGSGDWTISGGSVSTTNGSNNLHTSGAVASATGLQHKVTFTLQNVSQGYVRVGLSSLDSTQFNSDGTYTIYIESDGNRYLYFKPYGFTGSIDNVSVKQVDPNDRWSGISGDVDFNDGKATVNVVSGGLAYVGQAYSFTNGNTYKLNFTVNGTSGKEMRVQDNGGNTGGLTVANGTITLDGSDQDIEFIWTANANSNNLVFTRSTNTGDWSFSIDNVSLKDITFSDDVDLARINYDSNGDNGHILLEPTSTNLQDYSEAFNNWTHSNGSFTLTNELAPDGLTKVYKSTVGGVTSSAHFYTGPPVLVIGQKYTASYFFKYVDHPWVRITHINSGNTGVWFNIQNGTVGTENGTSVGKIEDYGNGWYRCSNTFTATDTASTTNVFGAISDSDGNTNSVSGRSVLVWGAQVENLEYPTSYIPVHLTSNVTRAAETLTGSGNSTLINSTEGVLYVDTAALNSSPGSQITISLSGDNSTDRILIYANSGGGKWLSQFRKNNSTYVTIDKGATISNQSKVAVAWESGRHVMFVNGVKATTYDTGSETESTTFDAGDLKSLQFSPNKGSSGNYYYGKVKALAVFNEALEDDELELLTGVTNYGSFGELASANGYTII